jgi:hypothetical protein
MNRFEAIASAQAKSEINDALILVTLSDNDYAVVHDDCYNEECGNIVMVFFGGESVRQ